MSAKYFCDNCGEEMKADDHERLRRKLGDLTIEVMHAYRGTWNGGNICHGCVFVALTKGEPADPACGYVRSRSNK